MGITYRGRAVNSLGDEADSATLKENVLFRNILASLPDQLAVPANDVCLVNEHKHTALYATTAISKVRATAGAVTFYDDSGDSIAIIADTLTTLYQPLRASNVNSNVRMWETDLLALSSTLGEGTKTKTALILETENTTWDAITNKPLLSLIGSASILESRPIKSNGTGLTPANNFIKIEVNGIMYWIGPVYYST